MSSKGSRKLQLVILLVLVSLVGTMSIAYAVLSTTLNINGTAQVQDASWNVHFDNIEVNPYSVEISPVITDNNKVSFLADLTTPGDFYKFTVDIVNEGSIDAMIESIIKTPELTADEKKYLRYEIEYVDGTSINDSQLLKAGETKNVSILFSYRNDIPASNLPSIESDFDLEIVLVYVQADLTGTEISGDEKLVKVVSGDLNTVGSEICIGEECFYLISNTDRDNIIMLAKYNLYVGNECISSSALSCTPYGEEATGIQDSSMKGFVSEQAVRNGTTEFALSYYWGRASKGDYVYNSNSKLYNYIENYKIYLESFDVIVEEARIIKMDELETLGCSSTSDNCIMAPSWIYSTIYWTGAALDNDDIIAINSTGDFTYGACINVYNIGVRPVVLISKSEF